MPARLGREARWGLLLLHIRCSRNTRTPLIYCKAVSLSVETHIMKNCTRPRGQDASSSRQVGRMEGTDRDEGPGRRGASRVCSRALAHLAAWRTDGGACEPRSRPQRSLSTLGSASTTPFWCQGSRGEVSHGSISAACLPSARGRCGWSCLLRRPRACRPRWRSRRRTRRPRTPSRRRRSAGRARRS